MKQVHLLFVTFVFLAPGFAKAATIADIIDRFEGEYTVVVPGAEVGRPEDGSLVIHSFVSRIDLPAFGSDVIYLEQRYGGPEGSITRQRIMAFSRDGQGIVTTAYDFPDGAKYARADAVPVRLTNLTPDEMYYFGEECRIRWTEDDVAYVGAVRRQNCEIVSRRGQGKVFVEMIYRLTGEGYSLIEQVFDASDRFLFGTSTPHPHNRLARRELDQELERILTAFEGGFENLPHNPAATAQSNIIGNLYTHVRRVNLPAFGTYVHYMEFTRGGPDGAVVRQRLNVFDSDPDRRANIMVSYEFRDGAAYVGAYADPAKLYGLKPEDLEPLVAGCELIWSTVRGVLTGITDRTTCHRFNERLQVWRHVSFIFLLDDESMHLWEHSYSPEGNLIFGSPMPIRFPRVKSSW